MRSTHADEPSDGILSRLSRWQQIALAIICLGLAALMVWHWTRPATPNGHIPIDFPNTWLAVEDDGHPDRIVVIPGRTDPPMPLERDGKKLFYAYHCLNEKCPGRVDGQPFVFAHWPQRPCPRCGTVGSDLIQRHHTPEGEAILAEIRRSFAP